MKNNPGRWICQLSPRKCDGNFILHGLAVPCPLAEKCLNPAARWTPYQYPMQPKKMGYYSDLVDINWRTLHRRRLAQLRAAFIPERVAEINAKSRAGLLEIRAAEMRERRRKTAALNPKPEPVEKVILPCGEDCRNCPYEACRYTDSDKDALLDEAHREHLREQWRASRARKKARELVDPEYAQRRRQQNTERCRRYYQNKKMKAEEKKHEE